MKRTQYDTEIHDLTAINEMLELEVTRLRSILTIAGLDDKGGKYIQRAGARTVKGAYIPMTGNISDYAGDRPDNEVKAAVLEIPAALQDRGHYQQVMSSVSNARIERELKSASGNDANPYGYLPPHRRGIVKVMVNKWKSGAMDDDQSITIKRGSRTQSTKSPAEFLADEFDGCHIGDAFAEALPVDVPGLIKGFGL